MQSTTGWLARVYAIDLSSGQQVWSYERSVQYHDQVLEMAMSGDHFLLSNRTSVLAFAVGAAPVAGDDTATTDEDTAVTIDVLSNDTHNHGDTLTVTAIAQASNGSVVLNADGTVTYQPNANFNGTDSFTYTVSDSNGDVDTATVNVTVNSANDAPTVASVAFSIKKDSRNGTKVGRVTGSDVDGDRLTYSLSGAGAAAFAINSRTGTIYVANASLLNSASRSLRFVVEAVDGNGGQTSANARVTVKPAPQVTSILINDGHRQRSMIKELRVTFSEIVAIDPNAFMLSTSGVNVGLRVTTQNVRGRTVATLTFSGRAVSAGSLIDGDYKLAIIGRRIHDSIGNQLDGNGDGREGGDARRTFFRLFGDSDGDRDVDSRDRTRFFAAYGSRAGQSRFAWYFDYDSDKRINTRDRSQFLRRFD